MAVAGRSRRVVGRGGVLAGLALAGHPNAPQSLSPDDVYAVSVCVLPMNGLLSTDAVLGSARPPRLTMLNRNEFVPAYTAPQPVVPGRN